MSIDPSDETETESFIAHVDRTQSKRVVSTIVSGVAECTGREITDFRPLYEVVDPDTLTSFIARDDPPSESDDGHLAFTYAGCEVSVDTNGTITVQRLEAEPAVVESP